MSAGPCIQCAHVVHTVEGGADRLVCTHQPEGAAAPLTPHEQRNQPADESQNICGEEAIFWASK